MGTEELLFIPSVPITAHNRYVKQRSLLRHARDSQRYGINVAMFTGK